MIKDLKVRPETIKILEENIGSKIFHISLGIEFMYLTQKAKATRAKINKWNNIKLKVLHGKGNHQQNGKSTL